MAARDLASLLERPLWLSLLPALPFFVRADMASRSCCATNAMMPTVKELAPGMSAATKDAPEFRSCIRKAASRDRRSFRPKSYGGQVDDEPGGISNQARHGLNLITELASELTAVGWFSALVPSTPAVPPRIARWQFSSVERPGSTFQLPCRERRPSAYPSSWQCRLHSNRG